MCTVLNTIAAEHCQLCRSPRLWKCNGCQRMNDTPRTLAGERLCPSCGHTQLELSASIVNRLGGDPESFLREEKVEAELQRHRSRLDARLLAVKVTKDVQIGDGNCQFRALAQQLFADPSLHTFVRHAIVQFLRSSIGQEHFAPFFSSQAELDSYVNDMARFGTWGDELTLLAAATVFSVVVHVVTSLEDKWYHSYRTVLTAPPAPSSSASPERQEPSVASRAPPLQDAGAEATAAAVSDNDAHVFLVYLSPVHYDALPLKHTCWEVAAATAPASPPAATTAPLRTQWLQLMYDALTWTPPHRPSIAPTPPSHLRHRTPPAPSPTAVPSRQPSTTSPPPRGGDDTEMDRRERQSLNTGAATWMFSPSPTNADAGGGDSFSQTPQREAAGGTTPPMSINGASAWLFDEPSVTTGTESTPTAPPRRPTLTFRLVD